MDVRLWPSVRCIGSYLERVSGRYRWDVLVDGNHCPHIDYKVEAIVKGDSLIPAISAASIIAKVTRDDEMIEMDKQYPGYGFAKHKGYPTKQHMLALQALGVCDIHRRSYSPVKRYL